jgi:hypothetical protein
MAKSDNMGRTCGNCSVGKCAITCHGDLMDINLAGCPEWRGYGDKEPSDVKEIIEEWLDSMGYDGLHNDECGCLLGDLMPCGECPEECVPATKVDCAGCSLNGDCQVQPEGECDWIVVSGHNDCGMREPIAVESAHSNTDEARR